jgi:hypothetical protein
VVDVVKKGTAALVTTALVAFAAVLLVVFALLLSSHGGTKTQIGGSTFDAGPASRLTSKTPLLLPDLRGGDLNVWLQHTGASSDSGFITFLAHTADDPRCAVKWHSSTHTFTDCHAKTYPADGGDLPHYQTTVDKHGHVVVDFTQ